MVKLYAGRSAAMRSKPVAGLLVELGVAKSHSRPHVSDDNPSSVSQFKTMKYRPTYRRSLAASRTLTPAAKHSSVSTTTSTGTRASAA